MAEIGRSEWLYHHSGYLRDIMQMVARDCNRSRRYEWLLKGADDESCSRVNIIAGAMVEVARDQGEQARSQVSSSFLVLISWLGRSRVLLVSTPHIRERCLIGDRILCLWLRRTSRRPSLLSDSLAPEHIFTRGNEMPRHANAEVRKHTASRVCRQVDKV